MRRTSSAVASAALIALLVTGCASADGGGASAPSPKPTSWEEVNEAGEKATEDAVTTFEDGDSTCPEAITRDVGTFEEGATLEVIGTGEFMVSAVGPEVLAGACVVRSTSTFDGIHTVYDYAYVEGDEKTVERVVDNLKSAGFSPQGGNLFLGADQTSVGAWVSDDVMSEDEAADLDLGFGKSFVMVFSWKETPLG